MRFLTILSATASTLSALVAAQQNGPLAITAPLSGTFQAGQTVPIQWDTTGAPSVNLQLKYGTSSSLNDGPAIAMNIPNSGSYSWTIPSDIGNGDWAIYITDSSGTTNYSPTISIQGGTGTQSTAKPTTTTASVTSTTGTTSTTLTTSGKSSSGSSPSSGSAPTGTTATSGSSPSSSPASTKVPSAGVAVSVDAARSLMAFVGLGAFALMA